jgi:DNA helicase II / ATP-dependent DNA helicase PcrA
MDNQESLPSAADLSAQLNPAQFEAVSASEGPMLVLAGAGSGKTRVVEYRVSNLIRSGISPESILLLTFTRRAAREMIDRASSHDARCRRVRGGTFHAFAIGELRRHGAILGLQSNFTVLDQRDAETAVGQCAARLALHEGKKRFPAKETLLDVISKATNQRRSIEAVLLADCPWRTSEYCRMPRTSWHSTEF